MSVYSIYNDSGSVVNIETIAINPGESYVFYDDVDLFFGDIDLINKSLVDPSQFPSLGQMFGELTVLYRIDDVNQDSSDFFSLFNELKSGPYENYKKTVIPESTVTNEQMYEMSADTIKGRLSTSGNPVDLSSNQVTDFLREFDSANSGVVPAYTGSGNQILTSEADWSSLKNIDEQSLLGSGNLRLLAGASYSAYNWDIQFTPGVYRGNGSASGSPTGFNGYETVFVYSIDISEGSEKYYTQTCVNGTGNGIATRRYNDAQSGWSNWFIQENNNSGDETESTIKSKRPIMTIDNNSIEGSGNLGILYRSASQSYDWDTVTLPGVYRGNGSTTNGPEEANGFESVFTYTPAGLSYVAQTMINGTGDFVATRRSTDSGSTWGNWYVQQGNNSGDETTSTIKTKRPIKTVDNQSLEGSGDIAITGATDQSAVHVDAAGEIVNITQKSTPVGSDVLLIEDSSDSNNKKKITISDIPLSASTFQKVSHIITGWQSANYKEIFSHGFGTVPHMLNIVAICKVNDSGYIVGDEVDLKTSQSYFDTADIGFNVMSDSSSVEYIGANNASPLRIWEKNTGDNLTLTDTNWDVRIDAYKGGIEQTVPIPRVSSIASTGSLTINTDDTDTQILTALGTAVTIEDPSGTPSQSQRLVIRIKDDGTGRAITWDSVFREIGITLPTTTVATKTIYVGFMYNATDSTWDAVAYNLQA